MKFLFLLFTFIFNINSSEENLSINEVLFFQSDYWSEIKRIKTDLGYLDSVLLQINNAEGFFEEEKGPLIDIYFDSKNEKDVFVLNARASSFILSSINRGRSIVLSYRYIFSDSISKIDRRNFSSYDDLKLLTKGPNNTIYVENNNYYSYLYHVVQIYLRFINSGFIILENFESVLEDDFPYQPPKFKLRHFKSLYSCIKSYKEFLIFLNFINLEDDNKTITFGKKPGNKYKNKFKAYYLEHYLKGRFYDDYFKNKNKDLSFIKLKPWILAVFKECKIELIHKIFTNKIMVPIKGDFTVKFYFDRFYILIKEVIDEVIRKIDPDSPDCAKNCYNLVKAFIKKVLKMSKEFVAKSWEPLGAIDFFSKILNKKIENLDDYIEIDRMMCDFYNMVCCVSGIRNNLEDSELDFINPMLANNHEFRVSKGFEITSKSPYKLKEIKAYNSESYIFFLERDVDYFVQDLMNGFSAQFSLENLKEEKIHLIEVVTPRKKFHFHLNQFTMV